MRRAEVWRSTPFRLALAFTALFLISIVIASGIALKLIGDDLRSRLDANLEETFSLIARTYGQGDIEDLTASVRNYVLATHERDRVFYLTDPTGKFLAGNVDKATVETGTSDASATLFGLSEDAGTYRALKGEVAGNVLVVATSYSETAELQGLALSSFGWAAAIACIIALVAGLIIAQLVGRRLSAISRTMGRVGQGDLSARIPERSSSDDLDVLTRQINGALDLLSANVEAMQQVSVDIAHDLKTPLNRLSMTIEAASEKAVQAASNADELAAAQGELRQISATFDALLRIAQLETGARREQFRPVPLKPILDLVAEAYESVVEENGQTLIYAPELTEQAIVSGDKDLLTQLFANLVENAIRHSGAGSVIALNAHQDANRLVVTISDTGPGIPEDERDKVFRRMYRLDKSRTTPGTGLGLSLAKAIADLHGATIELGDNRPGLKVLLVFQAI